jgi:type III restriction enzyme
VKLLLKDFQTEAVERVVKKLRLAAREARAGDLQSVCLSSPTGSGKTAMATAAIEAIGEGDQSAPPEPEASFLWVTDQPELNEQTRRKMLAATSILSPDQLVVIDASFDQETFRGGVVYFLNIQKLGKEKGLVTTGDERTYTIWETVSNTVAARPSKFFVVIDEAHRGMTEDAKARNEAKTIIQKFIKGSPGEIPPVPLIFGISATPERFNNLVQGAGRTNRSVDVKPEDVRDSGLIKEVITLYHSPTDEKAADMTMLRAAARTSQKYSKAWDEYSEQESEPSVRPILVVQVQDASGKQISRTDLGEAIRVVRSELGNLPNEAFAHSFQEGNQIEIDGENLRYLAPPDVQEDPDVRVVLFKTSLNTGWDCPRAEVMMSFRAAADATLIAQLVGRMVRTPLARRVDADEFLNTVSLYLPHYDEIGLKRVIEHLTRSDAEIMPPVDVRLGADVVTLRRARSSEEAFAALSLLPSYQIPRFRTTSEVRRLMKLARLLARDEILKRAPETATKMLLDELDAQYGRLKRTKRFKALVEENERVEIRAVNFSLGIGEVSDAETIELAVSPENREDLFEAAGRRIGEGLHKVWWRTRVEEHPAMKEKAKVEFVALCFLDDQVVASVEKKAGETVQQWLKAKRTAIASLPEGQRTDYDEIRRLASEPEETTIVYPQAIEGKKADRQWKGHLYVDGNGDFPSKLNSWETRVIEAETRKYGFVGWLRNPDRKPWSLCVPYKLGGETQPLYPDFLVIRREGKNLVVDILDPHAVSLADAPAKAAGLAQFAARHYHQFGQIDLIIFDSDRMKRLNLADEVVRNKVKAVSTPEHLQQLFDLS